ncbi:MAG: hypothetical protein WBW51_02730 [Methyloceanibacter sp.]
MKLIDPPQPHAPVIERAEADAAHRDRLDQRHDCGPVDRQQHRSKQHGQEAVRGPQQQKGDQRPPGEPDQDLAAVAKPVGGKADGRREQDTGE